YPHDGGQGAAITSGEFYTGTTFPAAYAGKYFFGDYVRGFVRSLDVQTGVATPFIDGMIAPLEVANSPDGNIYVLSHGGSAAVPPGAVYEVRFVGANRAPTAVASADVTAGPAPLTVTFDGSASSDPDGDALT